MSEESTILDQPETENVDEPVTEPETPAEPAAPAEPPTPPTPPAQAQAAARADVIDIESELKAKESLADQLEKGDITYEAYAKSLVKHDRRIVQAQRQMAEPVKQVQQTLDQQKAAKAYWQNWGKGTDPAQTIGGKTFGKQDAQALFAQVEAEFDADPINQRPELQQDRDSAIYREFCKALRAGPKKNAARTTASVTRASGSGGASAGPGTGGSNKTARQRLNDGEIDLGADAQRLGMI